MKPASRVGDFVFSVEIRDGGPNCVAAEDRYFALAAALTSAWGPDGAQLARLIKERSDYSKEGAVGFSYSGDSPGEIPGGKVRVFFMDDALLLDQPFFEAAAAEFGLAAERALRDKT